MTAQDRQKRATRSWIEAVLAEQRDTFAEIFDRLEALENQKDMPCDEVARISSSTN